MAVDMERFLAGPGNSPPFGPVRMLAAGREADRQASLHAVVNRLNHNWRNGKPNSEERIRHNWMASEPSNWPFTTEEARGTMDIGPIH
jgi:hypothetical protein